MPLGCLESQLQSQLIWKALWTSLILSCSHPSSPCVRAQSCPTLDHPMDGSLGLLCPRDSPDKNTGPLHNSTTATACIMSLYSARFSSNDARVWQSTVSQPPTCFCQAKKGASRISLTDFVHLLTPRKGHRTKVQAGPGPEQTQ